MLVNIFYSESQELIQPALIYIGNSNSHLWRKFNITINTLAEIFPDVNYYIGDINTLNIKKYSLDEIPCILFRANNKLSHYCGKMIDINELTKFIQNELNKE